MMKNFFSLVLSLLCFSFSSLSFSYITPDASLTPGLLCTFDDPHFDKYDYQEKIARCTRNVDRSEKLEIAAAYGNIPQSEWRNYEFDHLIPLCAGGSNDATNLWPQPIGEAHKKDAVENEVCKEMRAGTMTQAQAIQNLHDWFNSLRSAQHSGPNYLTVINCKGQGKIQSVHFSLMGFKQISNISLSLKGLKGEDKIIRVKELVTGKELKRAKAAFLKKLIKYDLNRRSQNKYELFLPAKFIDEEAKFAAYLNLDLEGNSLELIKMECE